MRSSLSIAFRGVMPLVLLLLGVLHYGGSVALAQQEQLVDRPVSRITLRGLDRVPEQKILNNIRSKVGAAYEPSTARGDVSRLTRLGDFSSIDVEATLLGDGTVALTYYFKEQQLLAQVQVVGNRVLSDSALLGPTGLRRGSARDDFLIERGIRDMKEAYRKKGYFLTTVSIDDEQLNTNDVLIFEVIEGPRVRVRQIDFVGNTQFPTKVLQAEISTRTWFPFLVRGELDNQQLASDVKGLDTYYKDRGYLDVRVDRTIEISPDQKEAKVIFLIEEGSRFRVGDIQATTFQGEPLEVFAAEQLAGLMSLKKGDIYRADRVRRSQTSIQNSYGAMGYLDTQVQLFPVRREAGSPIVDVRIEVREGEVADVGLINVHGNSLTRDRIIRRPINLEPGRRFDVNEVENAKDAIEQSNLFNDVRVTVQQESEDNPGFRDVLVEVKEKNTGSLNFGVGFGSDSGVLGQISLRQDNFDIFDVPETFNELVRGRAFRGAGQKFAITFQPGNEIFSYDISLSEPNIFDTPYTLGGTGGYYRRIFRDYTEERIYGGAAVTRRFGDVWVAEGRWNWANIRLDDIAFGAPIQIYEDEGPSDAVNTGVSVIRTTIDRLTRPTKGSRIDLSYDNFGAYAGDLSFNRVRGDYTGYFAIDRDFLGRTSTLRVDASVGYIFGGEAPTYEKFYLGGRTLRGFEFRTVSPKGTPSVPGGPVDIPIGGNWLLFLGAQYQFPVVGEVIDAVFFCDSGTVTEEVGFDDYRLSFGMGIRLYLPQLGPTPMAFDFAFPIMTGEYDETQVFSFSAELPF
ncbi:MAG: outer membrane protein assembly factor BamA [Phycisphaerales bacterium]|nr:outer membrane protein assembly factor BamA [Phycisphaerales bacterium]